MRTLLHNPSSYAVLFIFFGLFISYWPLALCGVLALIFFGRWFAAMGCGLLLDVAYGPPVGIMHLLLLPFTFCALFLVLIRIVIFPYLRPRSHERI